jgi:hypothetical protein
MKNNINISAIELYSRKVLKPFLDKYFVAESISGKELISFCPIDQVNFFVIQQLLSKWKEEVAKLRSPYFDFQNLEVQDALKVFMDKLSQHILVEKDNFSPLLFQAINDTIHFAVAPISFFSQKWLDLSKVYSDEELKAVFKYAKLYPEIKDYVISNSLNGKTGVQIIEKLETEFSDANLNQAENVLSIFNEILPTTASDFRYKESITENSKPENFEKLTNETNDVFGIEAKPTTLDLHLKNKVIDLRSAMSLNQRIMFLKELFKGDNSAFEGAMSLADASTSYEKCVNTLIDSYSQRFGWEIDSEEVNQLFDLIGRKFYPETFIEKR